MPASGTKVTNSAGLRLLTWLVASNESAFQPWTSLYYNNVKTSLPLHYQMLPRTWARPNGRSQTKTSVVRSRFSSWSDADLFRSDELFTIFSWYTSHHLLYSALFFLITTHHQSTNLCLFGLWQIRGVIRRVDFYIAKCKKREQFVSAGTLKTSSIKRSMHPNCGTALLISKYFIYIYISSL